MRSISPFSRACLGLAAVLLALSLVAGRAADVVLVDSIKPVETAPATGPINPQRPFMTRANLKPAEASAPLPFEVAMKMRNFAEFQARVAAHDVVSPQELAAKYEPLPADYDRMAAWLTSRGLTISRRDSHHLAIFAIGTVSQVQQAMKVSFARVAMAGKEYTSAVTAPSVPSTLSPLLLGINGLQPHIRPHKHLRKPLDQPQATVGTTSYSPSQIAQAYSATSLYTAHVNGAGQTIAIVIDTFPSTSDLTSFWSTNGVSQSLDNIQFIQVIAGTLPATSGEETLDVEWSSSIAPGAKVRVYGTTDLSNDYLDEAYAQVFEDVTLHPEYGIHQMSLSFAEGEAYTTKTQVNTDDQYFAALANAGVTVFAASGDEGPTPDDRGGENGALQAETPASDPNVTGVGGTSLTVDANNNETGEVVWNSDGGASGGGSSMFFNRPSWQTGLGVPGGSMRLVPDISCSADPQRGAKIFLQGSATVLGGTSWASPTCAGFCALINQNRANNRLASVGLLGPQIYPLIHTTSFRDIISGSSATSRSGTRFAATNGYDEATGIGVPLVQALATALSKAPSLPTVVQSPPVNQVIPGQNATFTVVGSGSPQGYQWQRMPIGGTTWTNLVDGGNYGGSLTSSLTVSTATLAMSGDQFQCLVSYAGGIVVTSLPSSALVVDIPLQITTLAGKAGTIGLVNNTGTAAQFGYPSGVAVDSLGNIYVADFNNNVIREVTSQGVVTTPYGSTAGTAGSGDGVGNSASFNTPNGIAVDRSNNLYVADTGNNAIRKITAATGQVNTLSGAVAFNAPGGLAVDGSGTIYVADSSNNIIQKITATGVATILAGQKGTAGYANGDGPTQALFNNPLSVAVDGSGNVYVADANNEVVREITPSGVVSTIAGQAGVPGYLDGPSGNALFNMPLGLAVDSADNIYVTDSRVPAIGSIAGGNDVVRRISPAGVVSTLAGQAGAASSVDGTGTAAEFYSLQAIALNRTGTFYIADTYNQTIRAGVFEPTVSINATQPNALVYNSTAGQFTVSLASATSANLVVNYTVSGTAVSGTDYTALTGSVTILAGATSATIAVNPLTDSQAMTNLTVVAQLTTPSGSVIVDPTPAMVTIVELSAYQAWKQMEFGANASNPAIAGDLADPNNNGVPNLLEYAFNANPLQTGTEPGPVLSVVSANGNQYLALTYTQLNTDPNLTYTVQVTSDLTQQTDQWHSGATYTTVVSQQVNGATTQVTVRDNTAASPGSKRFIRLQVTGGQ